MGVAVTAESWHGDGMAIALRAPLARIGPRVFLAGLLSSRAFPKRAQSAGDRLVSEDGERGSAESPGAASGGGGGSDDFGELFRAYRRDVERVCRRMLGESGAQDAASEVFLRAQRALARYDSERPFRPWLLGIASHHCIDQLRRRARETRLFNPGDFDESDLAHPGPSPLRELAQSEQRREIMRAIDSLPRKYRLPIVLRYFEDLDYQAMAEILGVKRPQVGTLLFRAKRQLRSALSDRDEEPES